MLHGPAGPCTLARLHVLGTVHRGLVGRVCKEHEEMRVFQNMQRSGANSVNGNTHDAMLGQHPTGCHLQAQAGKQPIPGSVGKTTSMAIFSPQIFAGYSSIEAALRLSLLHSLEGAADLDLGGMPCCFSFG